MKKTWLRRSLTKPIFLLFYFLAVFLGLLLLTTTRPAQAAGVVTTCNEASFLAALSGGGNVTFGCDGTIVLNTSPISGTVISVPTNIDGNGRTVTISGNNARRIFYITGGTTVTLTNLTVANGRAEQGGAIFVESGILEVRNSTFTNNKAVGSNGFNGTAAGAGGGGGGGGLGGAIYSKGNIRLINSTFSGNQAIGGNGGNAAPSGSGNNMGGNGGSSSGGTGGAGLPNPVTSGGSGSLGGGGGGGGAGTNTAGSGGNGGIGGGGGGGAARQSGNANGGGGGGGGLAGGGGAMGRFTGSTGIGGGGGGGGGIGGAVFSQGQVLVANSTIANNQTTGGQAGLNSDGTIFAASGTGVGGGIYQDSNVGVLLTQNSIYAGNSASTLVDSPQFLVSFGYNLFQDITGANSGNFVAGDQTGVDPLLDPLANYGGTTFTMRLRSLSPAIDKANPSGCYADLSNNELLLTDQRGAGSSRNKDGDGNGTVICDIGAYEAPPGTTTVVTSTPNPSVFGQPITITAVITSSGGIPTGQIVFSDNGTVIFTGTIDAVGQVSFVTNTLSIGIHNLTAFYAGNFNFNTSTSAVRTQTVNKADTTTSLASLPNPSVFGENVVFTATVTANPPGSGVVTGTVTFSDNGTALITATLSNGVATFMTSTLSVGTHSIKANYNGNLNFNSSNFTISQVVNRADIATALTSSANPSVYGQSVIFTATLSAVLPGAGIVSGIVTFSEGATILGTSSLSNGVATFTTANLSVGSHNITASYGQTANFNASSGNLTQTVNPAQTTTNIASSVNPSVYGQAVIFTATVAVITPGAGVVTGTVTFRDGATILATNPLNSGVATFTTSLLSVGTHPIVATYNVSTNFFSSNSSTLNQVVNKADTVTTIAVTPNPATFGQTVFFTATVSVVAPGAGVVTGTIEFRAGATVLGTATLVGGIATFNTNSLNAGNYSVTAVFLGSPNFNSSPSANFNLQILRAVTNLNLTSSPNPSIFGQTVFFTATVTSGAGLVSGTIEFREASSIIATATLSASGVATFSTSALSVATHTITANYLGNTNFDVSTNSVNQVVNRANTTTSLSSSINPSVYGQSVTFSATVTPITSGAGVVTGTVTFRDNGVQFGTANLAGGVATFTTPDLTVGSHNITATFDGSTNFAASNPTALNQVVNKANTSTVLTSSPNPSGFGQAVTFTATVTPIAPGGGIVSGTVTFLEGASILATQTVTSGLAVYTTSSLSIGTHPISVIYAGNSNYISSTSAVVNQVVNRVSSTLIITSLANPSVLGQTVTFTAIISFTGAFTPSGTIVFSDNGQMVFTATVTNGQATYVTNSLTVGTHLLTAVYSGDANLQGSTSTVLAQVVNAANTAITLSSSINPSIFWQPITFTAIVSVTAPGAGNITGTVTFRDGATTLGTATLSGATATFSITTLSAGSHSITAVYSATANFATSTSNVLNQIVNPANTATSLTSNPNPSTYGQIVSFTSVVTPISPSVAISVVTGTVTFREGATVLGTASLSGGAATFTTTLLNAGTHLITSIYNGSTNFITSTSLTTVTQVVNQASTTISLTSSPNPATLGQSVSFTATINTNGGVVTGTITFREGATILGTANIISGTAVFTTSSLGVGTHAIVAEYGGNLNLAGSISLAVNQTISCLAFNVTQLTDDGSGLICGSLSYALNQAITSTVPVTINLSTSVISLTGSLPVVTSTNNIAITIAGACNVAFGRGVPSTQIIANPGAGSNAFTLTGNMTLSGVSIIGFGSYAVVMSGDSNTLNCSWLGTTDGTTAPNPNNGGGVQLIGSFNKLGTDGNTQSGNLISGNFGTAVQVESGSRGNTAAYNWIGLQSDGVTALRNTGGGLKVLAGGQLSLKFGNRIKV